MHAGIDVGARRLHGALLDEDGTVIGTTIEETIEAMVAWVAGCSQVGVDAPESISTAPHRNDLQLPPKFRTARCAEIALARERGIWVPWVTPAEPPVPAWMEAGFGLFSELRAAGHDPAEVYPAGAFWLLSQRRWPPRKGTPEGRVARLRLLAAAGIRLRPSGCDHHGVDALMAALVARDRGRGRAVASGCGHDGSAIWMPALADAPDRPGAAL